MSRPRQRAIDNKVARDILMVLKTYAKDSQFYPTQGGLLSYMQRLGYCYYHKKRKREILIDRALFNHWFNRLVEAGYIEVDYDNTRAIRVTSLAIVERQTDPEFE